MAWGASVGSPLGTSIDATELDAGAVTTAKIADGSVTLNKIDTFNDVLQMYDTTNFSTATSGTATATTRVGGCHTTTGTTGGSASAVHGDIYWDGNNQGFDYDMDYDIDFYVTVNAVSGASSTIKLGITQQANCSAGNGNVWIQIDNLAVLIHSEDSSSANSESTSGTITVGTPVHLKLTHRSGTLTCYVNGSNVGTSTTNVPTGIIKNDNSFVVRAVNGATAAATNITTHYASLRIKK